MIKSNNGWTPLYHAACHGHYETVKLLLDHTNVDTSARTREDTPLHTAALIGHSSITNILLQHSPHLVDNMDYSFGSTPLHLACQTGDMETVGIDKLPMAHFDRYEPLPFLMSHFLPPSPHVLLPSNGC